MLPRHLLPSLCVAATVASCRPIERDLNFAGLAAGRRSLDLRNDIKIVTLTNGMTVAMIADDRTNLVSVDVRYKVGANQDPVGRAGLAHLVEHLTFETAAHEARQAGLVTREQRGKWAYYQPTTGTLADAARAFTA